MSAIPTLNELMQQIESGSYYGKEFDSNNPNVETDASLIATKPKEIPSLESVMQSINIENVDNLNDIKAEDAPYDQAAFLATRRRLMIDRYSSEFGSNVEDRNEPRVKPSGFWQTLLPGVGTPGPLFKNTESDVRNVMNYGIEKLDGDTSVAYDDADSLMMDLYNLQQEFPDMMDTDEGKALIESASS